MAIDDDYRIFETIWRNIDRENNLINQRITWAILLSGGVFAATAVIVNAIVQDDAGSGFRYAALYLLMAFMASVAIFFSVRTHEGVKAAQSQLDYLMAQYRIHHRKFEAEYGWPRPFGDRNDHLRGNHAARTFPAMMVTTWIAVFLLETVLASLEIQRGLQAIENRHLAAEKSLEILTKQSNDTSRSKSKNSQNGPEAKGQKPD